MERTRNIFLIIVFSTLLIMLLLLTGQTWANRQRGLDVAAEGTALARAVVAQRVTLTAVAQYTPPPTATATMTPTATPDRAATAEVQAAATRSANQALYSVAQQWPLLYFDTFDDNSRGWSEGAGDVTLSTGERRVLDGAYVWDLTAVDGFWWVQAATGPDYEDFFLAADLAADVPGLGQQHIIFRYHDSANYYLFGLCGPGGRIHARSRVEGTWATILPCAANDAVRPNGVNRLAVIGQGERFLLFVNDVPAGEFRDARLAFGRVGVQVEMEEGDVNVYRFDNFELRVEE